MCIHFWRFGPGDLDLSPFPDEIIFMGRHVSSMSMYTVIHPLTFLESLPIFSNKIESWIHSRVSAFDHNRSNYHYRKVLSPVKISCFNEILFLDKLYNWLDFYVAL